MHRTASFALALFVVSSGCDGVAPVDPEAGAEVASAEDLAAYRAAFVASGVEDYRLRYQTVCFCAPSTVEVRVEDGRVVRTEIDGGGGAGLTVLDLYDVALDAFAEADGVTVRVRPGPAPVPTYVYVDPSRAVADEEFGYAVLAFERD